MDCEVSYSGWDVACIFHGLRSSIGPKPGGGEQDEGDIMLIVVVNSRPGPRTGRSRVPSTLAAPVLLPSGLVAASISCVWLWMNAGVLCNGDLFIEERRIGLPSLRAGVLFVPHSQRSALGACAVAHSNVLIEYNQTNSESTTLALSLI